MRDIMELVKLCGGGVGGEEYISDEYAMPDEVRNGLLGTTVHWITEHAANPQPALAMANALAFTGAILGQRVTDDWDTRANLYTLGVGKSCCGKDHSRKMTRMLAEEAHAGHYIAGDDVTSEAAVVRVTKHAEGRGVLLQLDEIGDKVGSIKSKNASTHEAAILPVLTKLYTCSDGVYGGKEYADDSQRETSKIINPCLCVYGTGTPTGLWPNLTSADISNGFLGRTMIFPALPKSLGTRRRKKHNPKLVESVEAWSKWQHVPKSDGKPVGNIEALKPTIMEAVRTEGAQYRLDLAEVSLQEQYEFADEDGNGLEGLYGRALEQVNKVALIASAPLVPPAPGEVYQIEEATFVWALRLVRWTIQNTESQCGRSVADNATDRQYKDLLGLIEDAGRKGVSKSELTRKTQSMSKRDRDATLANLAEAREVQLCRDPAATGPGPAATLLIATRHLPK